MVVTVCYVTLMIPIFWVQGAGEIDPFLSAFGGGFASEIITQQLCYQPTEWGRLAVILIFVLDVWS